MVILLFIYCARILLSAPFLTGIINYAFIPQHKILLFEKGYIYTFIVCLECGVFFRIHDFLSASVLVVFSQSYIPMHYSLRKKNIMNRVKIKKCMFLRKKLLYHSYIPVSSFSQDHPIYNIVQ